jgi:hypothetical protein
VLRFLREMTRISCSPLFQLVFSLSNIRTDSWWTEFTALVNLCPKWSFLCGAGRSVNPLRGLLVRLFEFWRLVVRGTGFSRKMGYIGMPWQGVFHLKEVLKTELKHGSGSSGLGPSVVRLVLPRLQSGIDGLNHLFGQFL